MVTVPTYVPSYDLSGDTHRVAVGDQVAWELALIDVYLPEWLLESVRATAEAAEPVDPPYYWTDAMRTGSYVRHGSFVAYSPTDHAPGEEVELRPICAIGDSDLPDGGIPVSTGIITRVYRAADLLRQRPDGPWESVPGIGLVEVPSTEVEPDGERFYAYFPSADVDPTDGQWRHIGWIAMLKCN